MNLIQHRYYLASLYFFGIFFSVSLSLSRCKTSLARASYGSSSAMVHSAAELQAGYGVLLGLPPRVVSCRRVALRLRICITWYSYLAAPTSHPADAGCALVCVCVACFLGSAQEGFAPTGPGARNRYFPKGFSIKTDTLSFPAAPGRLPRPAPALKTVTFQKDFK